MLLVMAGIGYRIYRKIHYLLRRMYVFAAPKRYALGSGERSEKIIVSLASYPARFAQIPIALKSIMLQSMKPDRIIVWLDEEAKQSGLTHKMLELEQYGVEYRYVRDLKAHKKYFYVMQEFPDDIIITIDDDVIYPKDVIESLVKVHRRYPDAVCARRVHKITNNADGTIASYQDWIGEYRGCDMPSHGLVAIGVGGILYPPHCLYEKAFDEELIVKLCFKADDIWLKFMELLKGTRVVWVPCDIPMPGLIEKEQKVSLNSENVGQNRNDVYFANMKAYFGVQDDAFC